MSEQLRIQTFGRYQITLDGQPVTGFASRKADALFIYLACQPTEIPRDIAATLLWGDIPQQRALANLSVMLSSLRKQVGDYLHTTRHTLDFAHDQPYWLDVAIFEQSIAQQKGTMTRATAQQLSQVVTLYQGDFLAGFHVRHAPEFEAWMLLEQERWRQRAIGVWRDLATFFAERSQYNSALKFSRQWVQTDPLNETAQRQLIELLWLDGQQAAAMAQYEACRTQLMDDLSVEPEAETLALLDHIQQKPATNRPSPTISTARAVTRFFGRNEERAYLRELIDDPYTRLVTIIGTGGAGKSRLAMEMVRELEATFKDGATFVPLAAVVDNAGVWAQLARSLGYKLRDSSDSATQLLDVLREQERLLVLDNLEQLLTDEVIDFIVQLVTDSAELMVIITSRERLNLQAEAVVELRGLPTDHASRLFRDRAQRQHPNLTLEPALLTELCELVTGLPLALELSASLVRALSLKQIVANVRSTLDTLATTMRDVPARHRSMRAIFDQSWHLLTEHERTLYAKLSLFRGGFSLKAAIAIANATSALLAALIDKSLLSHDEVGRYQLHPLLGEFSAEKLLERPSNDLYQRFRAYFVHHLVEQTPLLDTLKGAEVRRSLEEDSENVYLAWSLAVEVGAWSQVEQATSGIHALFGQFNLQRGMQMLETALTQLSNLETQTHLAMLLRIKLGQLALWQQHHAVAEENLKMAMVYFDEQESAATVDCLVALCGLYHAQGDIANTAHYGERAYAVAQRRGRDHEIGRAATALANAYANSGDKDRARQLEEEALTTGRRCGDIRLEAFALHHLALLARERNQVEEGLTYLYQAQPLYEALGERTRLAYSHNHIAGLLGVSKRFEEAYPHFDQALAIAQQLGDRRAAAYVVADRAATAFIAGNNETAQHDFEEALTMLAAINDNWGVAGCLMELGTIAQKTQRYGSAWQKFNEAVQLAQSIDAIPFVLEALQKMATLLREVGEAKSAVLVLGFVEHHDSVYGYTRDAALEVLQSFDLPVERIDEWWEIGRNQTLPNILTLLTQYNR